MTVSKGSEGMDPYAASLANQVRNTPKDIYQRRLLIWIVAVASVALLAWSLIAGENNISTPVYFASTFTLAAFASFGACIYFFARFALGKQYRYLLDAIGFACLFGASSAQMVESLQGQSPTLGNWTATASYLLGSLFLTFGIYSKNNWSPVSRRDALIQLCVAAIATGLLPAALFTYHMHSSGLDSPASVSIAAYIINMVASMAAFVLFSITCAGHHRRCLEHDRISALLCYFFAPFILASAYYAISSAFNLELFGLSHIMFSLAWVVPFVGVGIENAFTFREAAERVVEMETLHAVSWALVGVGSVYELLDEFVRALTADLGAKVAAVYISDEQGENLELAAICGLEGTEAMVGKQYGVLSTDRRPGFHTGHTAKAFLSQEMQIVPDVFADVEFVPWKLVAVDDGCAVSLPLVDRGRAIGVVNLYFNDRSRLTKQRINLLVTIAAAATPAVENALVRERGESSVPDRSDFDLAA